jgi:hypothetical protein
MAKKYPDGWFGWPDQKRFALVLTHDVESKKGFDKCKNLAQLEERLGFRSSFNFLVKVYKVSPEIRHYLINKGFEVAVHGLTHDGKLFQSQSTFNKQVPELNKYLNEWKAVGFRTPSMLSNLDWIHALDIEYDSSTFDTDPFEPEPEGVRTVFPFWVSNDSSNNGYVELPYTLPQDFTIFILMKEQTSCIWKQKLNWIAKHGGMVLINTHPDYMKFEKSRSVLEEYPAKYYEDFLKYIKSKYEGQYWHVLPKDMARFWSKSYFGIKPINNQILVSMKKDKL